MPDFDSFVIFAAMRTGSNLLEAGLNQFTDIRCHGELFNPFFIGEEGQHSYRGVDMDLRARHPDRLLGAIQEDDVVSGYRMFRDHDARMMTHAIEDQRCAKIVLKRQPLDSYLSVKSARETGQWRVGKEATRRQVRVIFDADEFDEYCADQAAFYEGLEHRIRRTGQTYFPMRFEDCKDVRLLNGLATWLGADDRLDTLKETIKRQNPAALRDRIENFDAFEAYLARSGYIAPQRILPPDARPLLKAVQFQRSGAMVEAVLPGNGATALKGAKPFKHLGAFSNWMGQTQAPVVFSVLRDPLTRAYDAFMRHIFHTGEDGFPYIRRELVKHHGLNLPEPDVAFTPAALAAAGYDLNVHGETFVGFLRFLKHNIAGETGIRVDAVWAPQAWTVDAINALTPLTLLVAEKDAEAGFTHLRALAPDVVLSSAIPEDAIFSLSDILTDEMKALARDIYAEDYSRFRV